MPDASRPGELDPALSTAVDRLAFLVQSFEDDQDAAVRERAVHLLKAVDTVHRIGLTRLAAVLDARGGPALEQAMADPAIRLLFELYDLLPDPASFVSLDDLETAPLGQT